ncbi:MAG: FadR/GntR family transcriptional regulator [Actinomycetaceae bacterium]|nr:FadR/GntR family transcriptional regulator [Actinomycetaceae bacterium]
MSAVRKAMDNLRLLIATGELKPGDKLPSENELTERFGVSRGSVREAMKMLSIVGVLDSKRGAPTQVSALGVEEIFSSLELTIGLLPLDSFLEIYEIRRILETAACEMAASRCTEEDIDELEYLAGKTRDCSSLNKSIRFDHMFHEKLISMAGNDAMGTILGVFRSRSEHYDLYQCPRSKDFKKISDDGHDMIVEALRSRNPALARMAATEHIYHTERWLRRYRPEATTGQIHKDTSRM